MNGAANALLLISLFRRCAFIDEIDDTHIRDTRIRFETNLTSSAVRIAHLDVVGLDLWTELSQTVLVQLGERKASVASKAATAHTLRQEDLRRTHLGEID